MLANIDFLGYIVWGRDVAFKGGNLFKDCFLIRLGGLVHIEEGDNLLTIHIVVRTFAVLIDSTVIHILAVEYCKIVIHVAVVSRLTEGVFDDEPLESKVVRIFANVAVPIEKRTLLLFKILRSGVGHGTGSRVEVPNVPVFDE